MTDKWITFAGALIGCLVGIGATIYAVGILTVGVSLRTTYADTFAEAWYTTSLLPKTLVGVYGFWILIWPVGFLPLALLVLTLALLFPLLHVIRTRLVTWQLNWHWLSYLPGLLLMVALSLILYGISLVGTPILDILEKNEKMATNPKMWLLFSYSALTIPGGMGGAALIYWKGVEYQYPRFIPERIKILPYFLLGITIVYLSVILGALFFAGMKAPPLPTVTLIQAAGERNTPSSQEPSSAPLSVLADPWRGSSKLEGREGIEMSKGRLVSQYGDYWYIFQENVCRSGNYDLLIIPKSEQYFLAVEHERSGNYSGSQC